MGRGEAGYNLAETLAPSPSRVAMRSGFDGGWVNSGAHPRHFSRAGVDVLLTGFAGGEAFPCFLEVGATLVAPEVCRAAANQRADN